VAALLARRARRADVQCGLRDEMGDWNAILVQTLASSILHIGKPLGETFGAVLGGLVWGVIAFRSRSLLVPLLTHWVLGLSLDLFIVCR
jgi:membrane protease YdiL (CAAX protease family)